VNALHTAYGASLSKPALSHTAHKVASSAFAVEAAMRDGRPLASSLAAAVTGAGGDPLVAAAAAAVPTRVALVGAATREMLYEQCVPLLPELTTPPNRWTPTAPHCLGY
jgi:hypothetical protein